MRKFLKRLRKGIRSACLTAVLATCWGAGQTAQATLTPPNYGDAVTFQFSGTVSPTSKDIAKLFLIYNTNTSGGPYFKGIVNLGDFKAGQTTEFSVLSSAVYDDSYAWYLVGLYGDISNGQYQQAINGITIGPKNAASDVSWEEISYTDEQTAFGYIYNNNPADLYFQSIWPRFNLKQNADVYNMSFSGTSNLFNFTQAAANGQMSFNAEIVPEPVTILLFGGGGVWALLRRPPKKIN
jgi:hypothetical protein